VIGAINLGLGFCAWPGEKTIYRTPEQIIPVLPVLHPDAGLAPDAAPAPAPAPGYDAALSGSGTGTGTGTGTGSR
jgi:hypothetical protein